MDRIDQINKTRYSQMQSAILNKSNNSNFSATSLSSPSKLNLVGKFAYIEQEIKVIQAQSNNLTDSARDSARVVTQMKKVLIDKQLGEYRLKCTEQVKKFEKHVSYGVSEANNRNENLWSRCKKLTNQTQELKSLVTIVNSKINKLETILGYYSGSEIVSNY